MTNHPFIQPHPPEQNCAVCGKPVLDPCHEVPYEKAPEENEREHKRQQEEFERLVEIKRRYAEPETQEHGEPYE